MSSKSDFRGYPRGSYHCMRINVLKLDFHSPEIFRKIFSKIDQGITPPAPSPYSPCVPLSLAHTLRTFAQFLKFGENHKYLRRIEPRIACVARRARYHYTNESLKIILLNRIYQSCPDDILMNVSREQYSSKLLSVFVCEDEISLQMSQQYHIAQSHLPEIF